MLGQLLQQIFEILVWLQVIRFGSFSYAVGNGTALCSAAAMLYATLQGYDAEKTLDYGMAAGIAAVTHERTINPNMSVPLLESILQAYRP